MNYPPVCPIHLRAMICPCCTGSKGGKTTGPSKARTGEQAQKAAKARWAKKKSAQAAADLK